MSCLSECVGRETTRGIFSLSVFCPQFFHNECIVLLKQEKGNRHQSKQEVKYVELVATKSMCGVPVISLWSIKDPEAEVARVRNNNPRIP